MAAPQEVFLGFGAQERHSRKIEFHCIIVIVIIIIIIIIIFIIIIIVIIIIIFIMIIIIISILRSTNTQLCCAVPCHTKL